MTHLSQTSAKYFKVLSSDLQNITIVMSHYLSIYWTSIVFLITLSFSKAISLGQITETRIQTVYIYVIENINIPPISMLKQHYIYFTGVIMLTYQKFYSLQNLLLPYFQNTLIFPCLSSQAILVLKSDMQKRIYELYTTADNWALLQHLSSYVKKDGITEEWYINQCCPRAICSCYTWRQRAKQGLVTTLCIVYIKY